MAAGSRLMITEAEGRFRVRLRVAIPPTGFGERRNHMHAWLDDTCGAQGWSITPAEMRGVVNDAVAVYFREAAFAAALRLAGAPRRADAADSVLLISDDEGTQRVPARHHKTP
jgi:hypothetical protein